MKKMTLKELREYIETMPEGVMVIVEFEEGENDGGNESADESSD